ncbi:hypothetical protein D3C85_680420 [compost metagenome]
MLSRQTVGVELLGALVDRVAGLLYGFTGFVELGEVRVVVVGRKAPRITVRLKLLLHLVQAAVGSDGRIDLSDQFVQGVALALRFLGSRSQSALGLIHTALETCGIRHEVNCQGAKRRYGQSTTP